MIQDLHAHTYYSFCGKDRPETVIEAAIAGGVECFGLCDHNYGIAGQRPGTRFASEDERCFDYQRSIDRYLDHLTLLRDKCADKIRLLRGIEIATQNEDWLCLPESVSIAAFDYCLIEHIDQPGSRAGDLFAFAERCGCGRVGIAHTDLPGYLTQSGVDVRAYFGEMAKRGIFWELNVNYDSIHGYREHGYVRRFFETPELIEAVRESGLEISVGFDGHRVEDYAPERVRACCEALERAGVRIAMREVL